MFDSCVSHNQMVSMAYGSSIRQKWQHPAPLKATARGEIQAAHGQQHIVSGASDGSQQGTHEAGA